jgi:hypothetical protein
MELLRRFFFRLYNSTQSRKASRALLKAAKAGDQEQYLALVANYINLAQAYLGSSFAEAQESRLQRSEAVFINLWKRLRYAERLSDFEFMLAQALLDCAETDNTSVFSQEPLVTKLRLLEPTTRLAILAYEFEKWPLRWVALVLRMRPGALHRMLSEARCELCGISWESLAKEERQFLVAISEAMDKCPNVRANMAMAEKICDYPKVTEIKAMWLELRPQLVEVRHRYIPEQDEREQLLGQIFERTRETEMQRPAMMDRVVNSVHFSRHGISKVS